MAHLSNEQLCLLARNGDQQAMEKLLNRNWKFILSMAGKYAVNYTQKDDLIQVGLIAMWQAVYRFDPTRELKFLTFAGTLMHNAMFDFLRQKNRIESYGSCLPDEGEPVGIDFRYVMDPYRFGPESITIRADLLQRMDTAMNEIQERQRRYLRYRFGFQDTREYTQEETAEHFHLNTARAKNLERDALKELRKKIDPPIKIEEKPEPKRDCWVYRI